jgi:purine-binding chemotaxis protein CheW
MKMQSILTFKIDHTKCAVEINSVLEIVNYSVPTPLPCAKTYVEGLIYSREQGITVINLGSRFNDICIPRTKDTRIIVIEAKKKTSTGTTDEQTILFGIVADTVESVIEVEESLLQNIEQSDTPLPVQFLSGSYRVQDDHIYLLNIAEVMETL